MFLRLWTRTPRTTMLSFPASSATVAINEPLYNARRDGKLWTGPYLKKGFDVLGRDIEFPDLPSLSKAFDRHIIDFKHQAGGIADREKYRISGGEMPRGARFQNFSCIDGHAVGFHSD